MTKKRMTAGVAVACLALVGSAALAGPAAAQKKGKKKKGGAKVAKVVNNSPRAIPDAVFGTPSLAGKLATPLNVGKKFKGQAVGTVKVTLQTTGLAAASADDLAFRVTAPNGRTVDVGGGFSGQSIGPLTLTPNSPVGTCGGSGPPPPPPCSDPDDSLGPPYVGTAGDVGLALFFGVPMRGTWTVSALDFDAKNPANPADPVETSTLNSVGLEITPAR